MVGSKKWHPRQGWARLCAPTSVHASGKELHVGLFDQIKGRLATNLKYTQITFMSWRSVRS
jgi:hypothetical protein